MVETDVIPHNEEAEKSVLGAIFLAPDTALPIASKILTPRDFYREVHSCIFEAMQNLGKQKEPIEIKSVLDVLHHSNLDAQRYDRLYLMNLYDAAYTAANIEYYCSIVEEMSLKRQAIYVSTEAISILQSDPNGLQLIRDSGGAYDVSKHLNSRREKRREWLDIIPLPDRRVAPFPVEALPDWLRDWVHAESDAKETPKELQGGLVLGSLSAALNGRVEVSYNGRAEPCNLYVATILPSGERKSPSFSAAVAPIREWEKRRVGEQKTRMAEAKSEQHILKMRLNNAQKYAATDRDRLKRQEAESDALSIAVELADFEMPQSGRFLVDDVTPEEFIRRLSNYGGRAAILSDEAGLFRIFAGQYNNGIPNLDAICKAYDGSPILNERVGREEAYDIPRPLATVMLTPQPFIIEQAGKTTALKEQGFLARFMLIMPQPRAGYRTNRTSPTPDRVVNRYEDNITCLLDMARGDDDRITLGLSQEAKLVFLAFQDEVEKMLRPEGELGDLKDWGNKLSGRVLRIAGLLHMAESAESKEGWPAEITGATLQNAVKIGQFAISHAIIAFGQACTDSTLNRAKRILEWIKAKKKTDFSRRNLQTDKPTQFRKACDCDEPIQLLIYLNYLVAEQQEPDGRGRHPDARYIVSEKFLDGENPSANSAEFGINDQTTEFDDGMKEHESSSCQSAVNDEYDPTLDPFADD